MVASFGAKSLLNGEVVDSVNVGIGGIIRVIHYRSQPSMHMRKPDSQGGAYSRFRFTAPGVGNFHRVTSMERRLSPTGAVCRQEVVRECHLVSNLHNPLSSKY